MRIHIIGTIISIALIFLSGVILTVGIDFFRREKVAGKVRTHLLVYSIAAAVWGICYGSIGFAGGQELVQIFRRIGIAGINVFLVVDFCFVADMTGFSKKILTSLKHVVVIAALIDWWLFSKPEVDTFFLVDGYMTWTGNSCFGRTYHNILMITLFFVMATMGIVAYKSYELKRQKNFLVSFYCANLLLALGASLDTLLVLDYALPTSAFGAIMCTFVLWIGTMKYNAFDLSIANLFDRIYDLMDMGVMILDEKQRIIYANPYSTRIIADKNYEGKHITDYLETDQEEFSEWFQNVNHSETKEFSFHSQNGETECTGRISAIFDKYQEPHCFIVALNDISKEVAMMEDLKRANSAKSSFLTSMSHEIRTPINAVLGMNELILRESREEKTLSYASNIEESGKRLLSLINDILDFSKIESGKMEIFTASYDTAGMINDLVNIVNQRAREKELQLLLEVKPGVPSWLIGDEGRIHQVILNILTNAIKYTDEGFVKLSCNYEPIDEDNIELIISVRDSGRGMENYDEDTLFQSFSRLDERKNRTIEGTGLGLAITKAILDLMNGSISVESIYGVGSLFTIRIPQEISNSSPIGDFTERFHDAEAHRKEYKASFVNPDAKILVVDDVKMNLLLVEGLLKETQVQVDTALSGEEAVKKCKNQTYQIILMDHMMPGMDGIECLHRIREEDGPNRKTPVIVLTANAIAGMRDMYLQEGFNDYLSKPIEGKKLEEILYHFIKKE